MACRAHRRRLLRLTRRVAFSASWGLPPCDTRPFFGILGFLLCSGRYIAAAISKRMPNTLIKEADSAFAGASARWTISRHENCAGLAGSTGESETTTRCDVAASCPPAPSRQSPRHRRITCQAWPRVRTGFPADCRGDAQDAIRQPLCETHASRDWTSRPRLRRWRRAEGETSRCPSRGTSRA